MRCFYAPGEEDLAAAAVEEVKKAPRFLSEATGKSPRGTAQFYLYPFPSDGTIPYYSTRGPGLYTGVFGYQPASLLSLDHNREWLNDSYPHELAHHYLDSLVILEDRWLGDGIPEFLAGEFARRNDPEIARWKHRTTPSLIALARTKVQPWDLSGFRATMKRRRSDPAYAQILGEQEVWRYAAAEELVRRWFAAARSNGVDDPLQDLLRRAKALSRKVEWNEARELAKAQTGRSIEELAHVTEEELAAARERAWKERADPNLGARVSALNVLAALGLPSEVTAEQLLPSLVIPAESADVKQGWVWQILQAAGSAMARANDPAVAAKAVAFAQEKWSEEGSRFVPPELWRVLAATNRPLALQQLVATIKRPDTSLSIRNRANDALKALTGQDVGWSIEASPAEREKAAARWQAEIAPGKR